jgi:hypothetical protein
MSKNGDAAKKLSLSAVMQAPCNTTLKHEVDIQRRLASWQSCTKTVYSSSILRQMKPVLALIDLYFQNRKIVYFRSGQAYAVLIAL